jgi:hypothetical protein
MATLALGILGTIIGGPIGGAIGAAVGGLIDQNLIIPALFPADPIDGQKISEFRVQAQDEGAAANICFGTHFVCAGTIRWTSDIIEVKKTSTEGGKGGGAQVTTYKYYVHLAIAISKNAVTQIRKIIPEGKLLYNSQPDITVTSAQLTVTYEGPVGFGRMRITSPQGGPDLSKFQAGAQVVITGFTNAVNNGTFKVKSSKKNTTTGVTSVLVNNANAVAESAGALVTLFQHLPQFSQKRVAALRFYYGSESQMPDTLIESIEGVGLVPGFRGTTYVVMERLALGPHGNRIPQVTFIGEGLDGNTVQTSVGALMARSGRSPSQYDVTALITDPARGYTVAGPQPMSGALQPLLVAHDIIEQEGNGSLRFFHRKNATIVDIPATALSSHEGGSEASRPIDVLDMPDTELPTDVTAKFLDFDKDGNAGSLKARKNDNVTEGTMSVDFPLVMTGGKAVAAARRLLWTAWANRQQVKLQLPPTYWFLQENDVLRLNSLGYPWLLLIQKIDIGFNWVVLIEATLEVRSVLTQSEVYELPDVESGIAPVIPPDTEVGVYEPPPTTSSGGATDVPHLIFAGCLEDEDGIWTGAILIWAPAEDGEYVPVGPLIDEGTIGKTINVLPPGPWHVWDLISTVDVYLLNGELETVTEQDCLNGANRAIIGKEIVGFRSAVLIGEKLWRLSKFLRGLRDTADQSGSHAVADDFVWLNAGFAEATFNTTWVGTTRWFKMVSEGKDPDDVEPFSQVVTGGYLRPFAPTDPMSFRAANGDLTVTWKRRSRAIHDGFASIQPPLFEESERYDVEFWFPATGSPALRRGFAVIPTADPFTVTKSVIYSQAQQDTDGLPIGPNSFLVRIYQRSEAFGRGKVCEFVTV